MPISIVIVSWGRFFCCYPLCLFESISSSLIKEVFPDTRLSFQLGVARKSFFASNDPYARALRPAPSTPSFRRRDFLLLTKTSSDSQPSFTNPPPIQT